MLTAINLGNTHIRMGLFENKKLIHTWRLRTDPYRTADEYVYLLSGLFREAGHASPDSSVFASVVPPLCGVFHETLARLTGTEPVQVRSDMQTGITIRTENPSELGADLLANAVAAYHTHRKACVVIDFGTALSFIRVNDSGELTGAIIAPGIMAALTSLISDTAQLHQVELTPPPSIMGSNTTTAIQSGIVYGYASLVAGIIERIHNEYGDGARVIATGGLSETYGPLIPCVDEISPTHTLTGLRMLYELNTGDGR